MTEEFLTSGLLNWYPWRKNASVKFVGDCSDEFKEDILCRGLVETANPPFDYIIAVHSLEQEESPSDLLRRFKGEMKPDGHLFLACENRLGLQYFAGDRDIYTNRVMDGIENYPGMTTQNRETINGRSYARYEIEGFIEDAGFVSYRGYSILPGLMMPQQIYSWDYLPEEDLEVRYTALYHCPETVFMDVAKAYDSLIRNGMFHQMANAYLIDCGLGDEFFEVDHITTSMDRGRENAMATLICQDKVYKTALYPEGNKGIDALFTNSDELERHNIRVLSMDRVYMGEYGGQKLKGCSMPYIKAPTAMQYLRDLIYRDKDKFIKKVGEFLDIVLSTSVETDAEKNEELAPMYENVYFDLVPLNCFYIEDAFVFFDQEFCVKNYPIGVVLSRALDIIYMGDKRMQEIVPISYFTSKYGLDEKINLYRTMGDKYLKALRNREQLVEFNRSHLAEPSVIDINRQRINYSDREYRNIFIDLMHDVKNKRIFVFGSGLWARKFIAEYGDSITIEALLDNNEERRGRRVEGICVEKPDVLKEIDPDEYKVFVCIKQYSSVLKQLTDIGVKNYGIYNPNIERVVEPELKKMELSNGQDAADFEEKPKKYHIGYVAGVFDLFHVGHLNLLRRAKEQCDFLLVGVVSDEQAKSGKVHAPYVGQNERMEIVQACRYVDKAFILPMVASGTRDVFRKYRFDVQFSGSDYEHDPSWLAEQEWLRERGADLVFFPYTQSTSSTKLKDAIESNM